jgi:WD40 repeat protein
MSTPPTIDPTKIHEVLAHKHGRPLISCCWDPQDRYVCFGAENSSAAGYDDLLYRLSLAPAEGAAAAVPVLGSHDSWVWALAIAPDGETLVTGGYDGRVSWYPLAHPEPRASRTLHAHDGWVRAVRVSPDGRAVASCGNDRLARVWNMADGSEVARLTGHESHVYNIAWHPDGSAVVSCDLKGVIKEWDVATGACRRDVATAAQLWAYDKQFRADIGGARAMAFRSDGSQLAIGGITKVTNAFAGIGQPLVVVLDWASGEPKLIESKNSGNGVTWGLAWHPAGFWIGLAGGGGGGWIRFFKPDASEDFHAFKLPANGRAMAVAPDATRIAVGLADGTLRIYALHA